MLGVAIPHRVWLLLRVGGAITHRSSKRSLSGVCVRGCRVLSRLLTKSLGIIRRVLLVGAAREPLVYSNNGRPDRVEQLLCSDAGDPQTLLPEEDRDHVSV